MLGVDFSRSNLSFSLSFSLAPLIAQQCGTRLMVDLVDLIEDRKRSCLLVEQPDICWRHSSLISRQGRTFERFFSNLGQHPRIINRRGSELMCRSWECTQLRDRDIMVTVIRSSYRTGLRVFFSSASSIIPIAARHRVFVRERLYSPRVCNKFYIFLNCVDT